MLNRCDLQLHIYLPSPHPIFPLSSTAPSTVPSTLSSTQSSPPSSTVPSTLLSTLFYIFPSFAAVCTINSIKVVKYRQISAK